MTELVMLEGKEAFTDEEMQAFEKKNLIVMKELSNVVSEKKKLEEVEKKAKERLEKIMDEYGIKSIDNEFLRITRIPPNAGKTVIDVDKMEKEEPDLFKELLEDYPKVSGKKKGYVKFDIKG